MRFVVTGTGLEGYTEGEISCDWLELGQLRVALQRTIDEIDGFVADNPRSFLSTQVKAALETYREEAGCPW